MAKKFAVFDFDGTLIRWQLYHATADTLAKNGLVDNQDYQAMKQGRMNWKNRLHLESFRQYEKRTVIAFENIITKISVNQFNSAVGEVFKEYKDQTYTYTRDLIKNLKTKNYLLFAISGSQKEIVEKIAQYYGFDDYVGTNYRQKNGHYTGQVDGAFADKDAILKKLVEKHQVTFKDSIGVGDSESDIAMLELVEKPIAFNPTKALFNHAVIHDWKIVLERKNMVYELEGNNGKYLLA